MTACQSGVSGSCVKSTVISGHIRYCRHGALMRVVEVVVTEGLSDFLSYFICSYVRNLGYLFSRILLQF